MKWNVLSLRCKKLIMLRNNKACCPNRPGPQKCVYFLKKKSSLNLYLQFSLALLTSRVNTKDNLPTFNVSWKFFTVSAGCSKQVQGWTDSSKYCILLRNYSFLLSYSTLSCRSVIYNLGVPSFPTSASEREDYFLASSSLWLTRRNTQCFFVGRRYLISGRKLPSFFNTWQLILFLPSFWMQNIYIVTQVFILIPNYHITKPPPVNKLSICPALPAIRLSDSWGSNFGWQTYLTN